MKKIGWHLLGSASVVALVVGGFASAADAGGFAVRSQSSTSAGMAMAGNGAHDGLSVMFFNPAGVTNAKVTTSESHYQVILADTEVTALNYRTAAGTNLSTAAVNAGTTGNSTGNIAKPALVTASYLGTQVMDGVHVGVSLNAPFGLTTEPENRDWGGSLLSRTSKIRNIVASPTVGVEVAPGVSLGGGIQIGHIDATLKFGQAGRNNVFYTGDDYAVGWTLGALLKPAPGTSIGIGYRSEMTYDMDGVFGENFANVPNNLSNPRIAAGVELTTPDIVTVSLQQAVTDNFRVSATYEWTNWKDFDRLDIVSQENSITAFSGTPTATTAGGTIASLVTEWDDGWYASVGGEYDYSQDLTLRAGVGYEKSPIEQATQRLTSTPDNDRIWLSAGASYEAGQILPSLFGGERGFTTIDFAYTHIIQEDGDIERDLISNPNLTLIAEAETSLNIFSFALRTKFGAPEVESFK